MLTIWLFGPPLPIPCCCESHPRSYDSTNALNKDRCLPLNPSFFLLSESPSSKSAAALFSIQLPSRLQSHSNLSWGHLRSHSSLFLTYIFAEGQILPSSQGRTLYLCFLVEPFRKVSLSSLQSVSPAPSHLCFTRIVSFS